MNKYLCILTLILSCNAFSNEHLQSEKIKNIAKDHWIERIALLVACSNLTKDDQKNTELHIFFTNEIESRQKTMASPMVGFDDIFIKNIMTSSEVKAKTLGVTIDSCEKHRAETNEVINRMDALEKAMDKK